MLQGKKILLGITGSIAAYKTPMLVRLLIKAGAEVKCILTNGGEQFVTPLVLNTVSKNEVITQIANGQQWNNHVALGYWADVFLIAPASANTLSALANGQCTNALQSIYLTAKCPVIISPAMDTDMWEHTAVQHNTKALTQRGHKIIPPDEGSLASGLIGAGRMPEPEALFAHLEIFFKSQQVLAGKHVLITAGPTHEPIDPVRFIGNRSSGKMGCAIAQEALNMGAKVSLVYGPGTASLPHGLHNVTHVQTAQQMFDAAMALLPSADIAIMSAAVADYTPAVVADQKIKKQAGGLQIDLEKTKDILATCGEKKTANQLLVGFALETQNEETYAQEKLNKKNADIIILNSLADAGAGFATDTNKVTIFNKKGEKLALPLQSKQQVAQHIMQYIAKYEK
jgi:phosphopantothenoylcysteine decarboxylase / phosphopantothenate---cysteine ligase